MKSETLTSKTTISLEIKDVANWKIRFFSRMDRVLRRSLGVSETAPTDESVKPAPPVDPKLPSDEESEGPPVVFKDEAQDDKPQIILPDDLKDKESAFTIMSNRKSNASDTIQLQIDLEEIPDDEVVGLEHDEL